MGGLFVVPASQNWQTSWDFSRKSVCMWKGAVNKTNQSVMNKVSMACQMLHCSNLLFSKQKIVSTTPKKTQQLSQVQNKSIKMCLISTYYLLHT